MVDNIYKTVFDEFAEEKAKAIYGSWVKEIIKSKHELAACVGSRRPGNPAGEWVEWYVGSFNVCGRFRFNDKGPDAIIRFPQPGHTALAYLDQKVMNEIRVLDFLRKKTTIPIPNVTSWGLTKDSPCKLGPFMIMDFVEGENLQDLLKIPGTPKNSPGRLDPNVDNAMLEIVYDQIADYMLQLSQFSFSGIGAISEDPSSGEWLVTEGPLTLNMNEMAAVISDWPIDESPAPPFQTTRQYLDHVMKGHFTHLNIQRNLARTYMQAKQEYIARYRLRQQIPNKCTPDLGSKLFCDDLRPSNMLVDPKTFKITALIDWEWTNAMPADFSHDPPWWLLLQGPTSWFEGGEKKQFMTQYEPRMKQFLQALDRRGPSGQSLAYKMHESWRTGDFWFHHAIRKGFSLDAIYYGAIYRPGDEELDKEASAEMESIRNRKMRQLKQYEEEVRTLYN